MRVRGFRGLVVALVVLLLASVTTLAPAAPVKVVYWRALTGAAGDVQDELVKQFNASQSAVVAEAQFQGAYADIVQKLLAALAAASVPDLVLLDSPFVALFAKDDVLVQLDKFAADAKTGLNLKDFVPGLLADGYYKGKLYALPFMRSTPLLYFNRDMFAAAGLPDRAPDTWDEFRDFCRKMTKGDQQYGASFTLGTTTAHWYLQGAIYSYGGEVSDENFKVKLTSPEAVAAAQLWQDMVFKDKIALAGNVAAGDAQNDLLTGRAGMAFGSTGSMANLMGRAAFRVGMGFMPAKVKHAVPVGGSVLAMTSNDKARQAATWELMKFLTSPASCSTIVIKTGYMPTSNGAAEYPATVEYFKQYPERKIAIEQLKYVRPQASVISLGKGTEILRQAVEKLLIGNVPAAQVMKEAAADLEKEYAENFK
jgi:sn-glycerol 3-phosphate transport system substrate-binding protein